MSLIFYAWGEPVYVCLMLFSTVVDFGHGLLVEHYLKCGRKKRAKLAVVSSVIVNLALLGFFKYANFLIGAVSTVTGWELAPLNLALPIGISFYTFQTMSYTIDVYRGEAKARKNILDFGCYVAMFPQLIAGPIVRFKTIARQLRDREMSAALFSEGLIRFT
ncbi:MAG: MBOAT family protein, partial [Clostridiales bacterium]|nr:MBOAT family protein [Clostridiales bacterium]